MFNFFNTTKARKEAGKEIKKTILSMRDNAIARQSKHKMGTDYWHRYQWQINSLNDLVNKINIKFNIN